MMSRAREALQRAIGGRKSGRVFRYESKGNTLDWTPNRLSAVFSDAMKALGQNWEGLGLHLCRHTFATQLAESGRVTVYDLQRILGHSKITTSQLYLNVQRSLPDLSDAF